MKRTATHRKASAILTGDWHIREDIPVCRTDNSEETQWKKIRFISDLQKEHWCPVIHSGDLYNHWKPSPYLIAKTIEYLPDQFHTVYGNHDLPQHNLELQNKSGIHVLKMAKKLEVLKGCHWGETPTKPSLIIKGRKILVWHVMTYQAKKLWSDMTDPKAAKILRKYTDYDLILTGHNHQSFVEEHEGRLLVNPGSIMRMDADQLDAKPCIWLYYADTNTVEPIYIPIEKDAVNRGHLDVVTERNHRIDAFISKLNTDWEGNMSFEDNLEHFFSVNKTRDKIKQIVYKSMES